MRRGLLALAALLVLGLLAAGAADARTTRLVGFANKADRPHGYLLAGDEIHVIARNFIPKAICKPKVKFTLTDSSGKKFNVGSAHPKFGDFGEGAINRDLREVPNEAKPGKATLRSKQKCRLGQASGKDSVRIIDPAEPRPKITQSAALDVLSGDKTTLALSVNRYAYVYVIVEWELVPGEWRLIDVVANQEFLPKADTYSLEWRSNVGGNVPPGHYRFRITPRAPGVGNGQEVIQDFYVAQALVTSGGGGGGGKGRGRGALEQAFGVDVNGNARIVVADAAGRLREFDVGGTIVPERDFSGSSFGLTDGVFGPVDSSEKRGLPLFVADAAGRRVVKKTGAFQGTVIGSAGTGPGQFSPAKGPQALAATAENGGRLYVVDGDSPRVQAFDLNGGLQQTITGGGLARPQGVATAPGGTVWVADLVAGLRHFSAGGAAIPEPIAPRSAVALDVDRGGRVIAVEGGATPGLFLLRPGFGGDQRRFGGRLVKDPHGVASAGLAGDIYVTTGNRLLWFRAP